jgi:hypothetical protein
VPVVSLVRKFPAPLAPKSVELPPPPNTAPISAPCTWAEVESGAVGPTTFTLRTMGARVADVGDLWSDMQGEGRSLRTPMSQLRRFPVSDSPPGTE